LEDDKWQYAARELCGAGWNACFPCVVMQSARSFVERRTLRSISVDEDGEEEYLDLKHDLGTDRGPHTSDSDIDTLFPGSYSTRLNTLARIAIVQVPQHHP
jgi:hypothetical protein